MYSVYSFLDYTCIMIALDNSATFFSIKYSLYIFGYSQNFLSWLFCIIERIIVDQLHEGTFQLLLSIMKVGEGLEDHIELYVQYKIKESKLKVRI